MIAQKFSRFLFLKPCNKSFTITDSIIEGVEFHSIDGIRGEENIYEPAPGEVSLGRNQNTYSGKTSTNMENHM